MRLVEPKPFTYMGGNQAVLLLHGFTGSTIEVKKLGRYLNQHGYTCHAPLYKGHGTRPDQLILTGPNDWWKDAVNGYNFIKKLGFTEVAVVGISLGGLFSIRLGAEVTAKGIVTMCAPLKKKKVDDYYKRVLDYAERYMEFQGKDKKQICCYLEKFSKKHMNSLQDLQQFINETEGKLDLINVPTFVLQGVLDNPLYKESANIIYKNINTEKKHLKWYQESEHIITLGKEREKVYKDIVNFLNSLNWNTTPRK